MTKTRGPARDLVADKVIGKPSFTETGFYTVVPYKLSDPCGVTIRIHGGTQTLYITDKSNNRVLEFPWTDLATWQASNISSILQRVFGQNNVGTTAAGNHDESVQDFPTLPTPAADSLLFASTLALSPAEGGTGSNHCYDETNHFLYVADTANHRVLGYADGSVTATKRIGQTSYTAGSQNAGGGATPSNSSLYFDWLWPNAAIGVGMFLDSNGDLWIPDSGNCRVVRAPGGATPFDLVLGAANFTTPGIGNTDPATVGHNTLDKMGAPSAVWVNAARTKVLVCDPGNKRILVFNSPFSNGMSAAGTLKPGYTASVSVHTTNGNPGTLTDDRRVGNQAWVTNMWAGYTVTCNGQTATVQSNTADTLTFSGPWSADPGQGNSYTFSLSAIIANASGFETLTPDTLVADAVWVSDSSRAKTLFLIDTATGEILLHKGGNNILGDTAGGIGVDASGNVLVSTQRGGVQQDVLYFARSDNPTVYTRLFSATNNLPNSVTNYGLGPALVGVAAPGDQLVVAEEAGRILFWTGLTSLVTGQAANGYLTGFRDGFGPVSDTTFDTTGCIPTAMAADKSGHLWVAVNNNGDHANDGSLICYSTPLVSGAQPILRIALQGVFNHRAGTLATLEGAAISYTPGYVGGGDSVWGLCANDDSTELWVSQRNSNRVFRIRNPLTAPQVDCVLGQPDAASYSINRGGAAASNSMYYPGGIGLDSAGNLYVSDSSLESDGNKRFLIFQKAHIASGQPSTIYGVAADTVINNVATWQPVFGTGGQMVLGYNAYGPAPDEADAAMVAAGVKGRFPGVYNTPLSMASRTPDTYLQDYGSMYTDATFDIHGNLYLLDHNRGRVLIYNQPFAISSVPVSGSLSAGSGTLTRKVSKPLAGALNVAGALQKFTTKFMSGVAGLLSGVLGTSLPSRETTMVVSAPSTVQPGYGILVEVRFPASPTPTGTITITGSIAPSGPNMIGHVVKKIRDGFASAYISMRGGWTVLPLESMMGYASIYYFTVSYSGDNNYPASTTSFTVLRSNATSNTP